MDETPAGSQGSVWIKVDQREVLETSLVSKAQRAGGRELSNEASPGQERIKFNFPVGKKGEGGLESAFI